MTFEIVPSTACSWVGLFAAVWLTRHRHVLGEDPRAVQTSSRDKQRDQRQRADDQESTPGGRQRRRASMIEARGATYATPTPGQRSLQWRAWGVGAPTPASASVAWSEGAHADVVALPIDAPRLLDDVIDSLAQRLRRMPQRIVLGRRSAHYRLRLEQTLREATEAKARLAAGTYGACQFCSAAVSLARLIEKPWTPRCVRCELSL